MSGKKFDQNKVQLHYLPPLALDEVAKVFMYGAEKYGKYNWEQGMQWLRIWDAGGRHRNAFLNNMDYDAETKLYHMAHSAANDLMLLQYQLKNIGEDDRKKK